MKEKTMKKISLFIMLISLLTIAFMLSACASGNDFKLFTADELLSIMPATNGTLSDDKSYIRFTDGNVAFTINDLDQFDVSEYKYMVVGARASASNGNTIPGDAVMWYNDDPAFGVRYGFTSSFRVCGSWTSNNVLNAGETFEKVSFTVTNAKRQDNAPDGIDYTRGIATVVIKPFSTSVGMLEAGESFDISYIGFFKSMSDAEKFDISTYDPATAPKRTPFVHDGSSPVVILKFDDLGGNFLTFDRVAKILRERDIVASFGLVGNTILGVSPKMPLITYMKKWIEEDGIEIWHHGFYHTKEEFSTDDYDTQLTNFKRTLDEFERTTGLKITSFGSPHNNSGRDTIIMVKDNFPEIKAFFHGYYDDNVSSVYHIRNHCALEPGGVPGTQDLDAFKIMYSYQKYNSHIFIQIHPGNYKNSQLNVLEEMIDYLIADGCTFMTPTEAASDHYVRKPIEVRIENQYIDFDVKPTLIDGRTMVPLRGIFEALGAEVEWDGETRTVTSTKDGDTIKLTIGKPELYKNGELHYVMDVVPVILEENGESRTLVPVRAVAEAFGSLVHWEHSTKTVTIIPELTKQELGTNGIEIVKATYDDYQKDPVALGEYSFDGDVETYWYCEGKTDRDIVYELKDTATVKSAEIVWYSQNAPFEILVSNDNVNFELAAQGVAPTTFGEKQTVNINKEAKYIKVVTKYNGTNYGHGICEISFSK